MTIPAHTGLQKKPQLLRLHSPDDEATRQELAAGLLAQSSSISPKFLYDALGSKLFAAITELSEYYPTRTEASIFKAQRQEIAEAIGTGRSLIDLGAGNCEKAASLFGVLQPSRYIAIDISADFLADALEYLQFRYPALDLMGLGMDFSSRFELPPEALTKDAVIFYPGSSIGNFTPTEAEAFLRQVRLASTGSGLLIGVDLVKPSEVLEPAYDDALGVTAAFNLNMLKVANQLLGANFDVADFRHVAFFNAAQSRIEMHLEAKRDVSVSWADQIMRPAEVLQRRFAAGERIHTENSYKYDLAQFAALLHRAGYSQVQHWTDPREWFAVFWAEQ